MGKMQLGVIFGSRTCEHEVAIISAVQLMRNVNREKYDVIPIYISQKGEWFTGDALMDIKTYTPFDPFMKGILPVHLDLTAGSGALLHYEPAKGLLGGGKEKVVARLDCVIPVMHGLHGEDGSLQGLLELADIPYSSTGVTGSAVGMDKITMKRFFRGMGYPVLPDCAMTRAQWEQDQAACVKRVEEALPYPVFVKPACLGSSIGVSRADDRAALMDALNLGFSYDRRVLIEQGLDKPIEVNCSVLGYDGKRRASVLEMPNSGAGFLDFSEKYLAGSTGSKGMASLKRIVPAPIGEELTHALQALSLDIFDAMDCKGVVRIDYMLDRHSDHYYITEINTIPGSLAYYLWAETGLPYSQLIDEMVDCALRAFAEKKRNSFAFSSDILSGVVLGGKKGGKLKL
ncbi:MAG: D-alanine--D-alanine ligase family protein [Eubacteriales bacterium]|nr:D-alanine--D-alanine ligase family protein [Eubacteriales bacterium]